MQDMQERQVQSPDQEDQLEKEKHFIPVFLPGKFHGQRSLALYSPWDHKELDMTNMTSILKNALAGLVQEQ